MRRRPLLALLVAALVLGVAAVATAAYAGPTGTWRGRANATKNKVTLKVSKRGQVRFAYACKFDKGNYVYTGRLKRGGRFDLVRRSATLRKVVVAEVTGRVGPKKASGSIQQDVCTGAVERWSAKR
jgi:hypothetical protein